MATETIERGGSIEMEETDWLRRSFGEDFGHVADKLVAVRLPNGRADDVFAILLGFRADSLKDLAVLDLVGGTVSDEGLLQLKELKGLSLTLIMVHIRLLQAQIQHQAGPARGWEYHQRRLRPLWAW